MIVAGEALRSSRLRALVERAAPAPAAAQAAAPRERCELCAQPIAAEHRHILELGERRLLCACRACSILFDRAAAGGEHYRLVPDRCESLTEFTLDDLQWRALGLPVEMAFFVREGRSGRVTAYYPSLAGATESQLQLDEWSELERANPVLAHLAPDVEALLVNGTGEGREAWLVGIDECYRLVAVVRQHWRGLSGGAAVWSELERFFAALRLRARPAKTTR